MADLPGPKEASRPAPPPGDGVTTASGNGKKPRIWPWVALAIAAVGVSLAGAAVLVLGGFLAGGVDQAATITKADGSYDRAVGALTTVGGGFDAIQSAGAGLAAVETYAVQSKATLDAARAELATSRRTIESLGESEARATYIAALLEADKGLEAIVAMLDELTGKSALLAQVDTATVAYAQANDKLNAAVTALNKDQWVAAGTAAADARALFDKAREGFAKAQAMDTAAGMDKAVAYVDAQIERASTVGRMAQEGPRGDLKAYNLLVADLNALNKRIDAMPEPEALVNESWATARLDALRETAITSLTRADELMMVAHDLFAGQ